MICAVLSSGIGTLPLGGGADISWWQTIGALAAVFGLLLVFLRLLGRITRRTGHERVSLLTVWHLGPKREVQVVRLGQEAHYIYRHEGAMVLLKQEPLGAYEKSQQAAVADQETPSWKRFLPPNFPLARSQDPGPLEPTP